MSLPDALTHHFSSSVLHVRRPAWIEIDEQGAVLQCGGDLAYYGLAEMRQGLRATEQASFLVGYVPLPPGSEALPMLQMPSGVRADIHLFSEAGHGWVLLLDCSESAEEQAALQQARLDMGLRLRRELEEDAHGLAEALGVLVLARTADDTFRAFARVPGWARTLWPSTGAAHVEEVFPFLESFLQDAEDIWGRRRAGMLRSGTWTQEGPSATELHLEATATCLPPVGDVLMVELLGDRYWERQRILQLARDRRLALDELRHQQDQREILLHCIVHDLKGPLAGMQGSIDLLASDPAMPPDLLDLLGTARRACRKQLGLIEDIVSVFRHGHHREGSGVHPGLTPPFDMAEFAAEVFADFQPSFVSSGRTLLLDVPPHDRPLPVRADRRRIERVFANLLENAQRYTPLDGSCSLRIGSEDGMVVVTVSNEGKGVPEEHRETLFDRFVRGPRGGGTAGLGLYYCRITVEKYGGAIRYEERPGGGASFVFTLPLAETA
ncbi:MAG: HAMP domain-containing sensor histidine kinase [Planctomycetota bacterium]|nr:HAMP domain-containing sensor histidine kinase [Planctomycetota bacterium]